MFLKTKIIPELHTSYEMLQSYNVKNSGGRNIAVSN